MSFHGGLLGVLAAIALFARAAAAGASADVFDFVAPLPGIGLGAGRIGNFINGELWGKPTDVPWGLRWRTPPAAAVARHPSQLYEAVLEGLLLFTMLWWFTPSRGRAMRRPALFLLCYCAGALRGGVRARAGRAHRLPRLRLAHDGAAAVAADDAASACMLCMAPAARRAAVRQLPAPAA